LTNTLSKTVLLSTVVLQFKLPEPTAAKCKIKTALALTTATVTVALAKLTNVKMLAKVLFKMVRQPMVLTLTNSVGQTTTRAKMLVVANHH
jgi:hypothetical protein